MKHLFTLTLMCFAMGLNAQLNYPWNPDEDGDSSIGSNDLLGFLTVYGEDYEPEPITVDSVDLLSVILSLQNQIEVLQGQVDSLSTDSPNTTGEGGGAGVYVVKVEFSSGSISSSNFIKAAEDPSANDLTVLTGWTFTRTADNILTIGHPQDAWGIDFMTHAETNTGDYLSRMMGGLNTSQNVVIQPTTKDSMEIRALNSTYTGISNSGTKIMYITFKFSDNNILIE